MTLDLHWMGYVRLAHFGTFDVLNYGDLLFPLIAESRLGRHFDEIVHVSPIGGAPYEDVRRSRGIAEVLRANERFDAVMVGGGNLINPRPTTLRAYKNVRWSAYPQIWAGAAQLAQRQNIPLVFNSPGAPRRFGTLTSGIVRRVFNSANYASLRDGYSAQIVGGPVTGIPVVPDSALQIADILGTPRQEALVQYGLDADQYIAIHVNSRYGKSGLKALGESLDTISKVTNKKIALIAIGPCHGDDTTAASLATEMTTRPVVVDERRVTNIAHIIALSSMYIGSSLHGFITATSYGRPAIVVASKKAQHKFDGLLEHLDDAPEIIESWDEVAHQFASGAGLLEQAPANRNRANAALDEHWATLAREVQDTRTHSSWLLKAPLSVSRLAVATNYVDSYIPMRVRSALRPAR